MGSLADCLNKAGLSGAQSKHIARLADSYKQEGFGPQDAHVRAAKDVLRDARSTYKSVLQQVHDALEGDARYKVFPGLAPSKPDVSAQPKAAPEPETPDGPSWHGLRAKNATPQQPDALPAQAAAPAREGELAGLGNDMAGAVVDNMYAAWQESLERTGELPRPERKTSLGVLWNEAKKLGVKPEVFVSTVRSVQPQSAADYEKILRAFKVASRPASPPKMASALRSEIIAAATSREEGEAVAQLHEAVANYLGETPDEYAARFESVEHLPIEKSKIFGSEGALQELLDRLGKGETLEQGKAKIRGAYIFQNGKHLIETFEGTRSPATLVHESFHSWRRVLKPEDEAVVASWAGAKKKADGGWAWDSAAEEKFARAGERYLRTGKAPTPKLKTAFEHFKRWLTYVYKAIRGSAIDVNISPEMVAVYDKLFGTDATIAPVREQSATPASPAVENTPPAAAKAPDREQKSPLAGFMKRRAEEKVLKQAAPKKGRADKPFKSGAESVAVGGATGSKPSIGAAVKSVDPNVEDQWQNSKYRETIKGRLTKAWETVAAVGHSFRRHHAALDPKEYGATLDLMRRIEETPQWAKAHAINALRGISAGMDPKSFDVFSRVVILRDLKKDVGSGLYDNYQDAEGNEIEKELPFGYTPETLDEDLGRFEEAAKDPAVKAALERRQKFMHTLRDDLVDRKLLPKKVKDVEDYFHHQVLQYMNGERYDSDGLGMRRLAPNKKGWQKTRKGSAKNYNTDYLDAEFAVISQALQQLKVQDGLRRLRELNDVASILKANYGDAWKKRIPEGYVGWQPTKGNAFYPALSISEKALQNYIDGTKLLTEGDFKEILAVGARREEWIIPKELAATLDNFRPQKENILGKAVSAGINGWKKWTLTAPHRVLKYNLNNLSGDTDATLAYDPAIAGKYAYKAAKDLAGYHFKGAPLTPEISRGIELGVLGSGRSSEISRDAPHLSEHDFFKGVSGKGESLPAKFWHAGERATSAREDVLRLAAWRYFTDRLRKNPDYNLYGTSPSKEIDQMRAAGEPADVIAARLARDLLGDYGNTSDAGTWLRSHLIPFYSWWEINLPRYIRLFKNAGREGSSSKSRVGAVLAKQAAGQALKRTVQAGMFYGAVNLWNILMFPDEERELSDEMQRELHIILGRRDDGSIITVRMEGALSDFLSWSDLQDAPSDVGELWSGDATAKDKAVESLKAPINKFVGGSAPVAKTAVEAAVGRTLYPDVFEPRVIRDPAEHLAKLLIPTSLYRKIVGKPGRNSTVGGMLGELVSYSNDPGEAAYYMIRHKAGDFQEEHGKDRGDFTPGDQANALYYWKQSKKYGDEALAEKWLNQYYALGGTKDGLRQSVKATHPIGFLGAEERADFVLDMSKDEVEVLRRAEKWYKKTYGDEAMDPPIVGKGEPSRKYADDVIMGAVEEAATRRVKMTVLSEGRPKAATAATPLEEREAAFVQERDAALKWLKNHRDNPAVADTIKSWLASEKYQKATEKPKHPKRRSQSGAPLRQADRTTINDAEWAAMLASYKRAVERQERAVKVGGELK